MFVSNFWINSYFAFILIGICFLEKFHIFLSKNSSLYALKIYFTFRKYKLIINFKQMVNFNKEFCYYFF